MTSNLHGKNYYKTVVRNLRKIVKCGICGHRVKLQFHHLTETNLNGEGRGSNHRYYDIIKHPQAYIPLCYFCHQKVTLETLFIIRHTNQYGWITLWYSTSSTFRLDWIGASFKDKLELIHVI